MSRTRTAPRLRSIATACLAFALAAAAAPAFAQDEDDDDDGDGWEIVLGGGVLVQPDYVGSDDTESQAIPFALIESPDGRFWVRGPQAGYALVQRGGFSVGATARYRFFGEREEADNAALRGLGDIDGGADAGVYLEYERGPWSAEFAYLRDVSGVYDGAVAEFEAGWETALGDRFEMEVTAGVSWADAKTTRTYFGITPAQAARSGYAAYEAGSGLRDATIGVSMRYGLGERWLLGGRLEYARLLGDARDSPLVKDEGAAGQPELALYVGYRF